MKNMMRMEQEYPEDANMPLLETIVKQFGGHFMTLYFATQETYLTVPFPLSLIAFTDNTLYRRYAVSSTGAIDKDDDKDIIEDMTRIKKSPHIVELKIENVKKK